MPGKEGMIPNYILKTLEEEALEIKFNLDDLSTLYDERNIKIDEDEILAASKHAYEEYENFKNQIYKKGQEAIAFAKEHQRKCIVLAGRPYHVDPQINHGIHRLLKQLRICCS